jgi:hypothetical protein
MFADLVSKFDLLRNAPADNPEAFYAWAIEQGHLSTRLAASFVLGQWDPRFVGLRGGRLEPFDVFEAKMRWDSQGITVLVAWLTGAQARPMKGYELYDGATYWIAARDTAEAFATWVAMNHDFDQTEEMADALASGVKLRELDADQMRKVSIRDDGCDGRRSLLQVVEEQGDTPAVVACSEWP